MLWISELSVALKVPLKKLPKLPLLSVGTTLLGLLVWLIFKSWLLKLLLLFLFAQMHLTQQMSAGNHLILWKTDSKNQLALVVAGVTSLCSALPSSYEFL